MEYMYAALLLHKLKQDINEDNVRNVIKATGVAPDDVRIKSLVTALSEVNIDEALKSSPVSVPGPVTSPAATSPQPAESKEEEKKEEKKEEEALEGLSALFG
ncbi:MAG: 50S ribosomal protein P1 [Nitrososphaeraceae archaeon]|jgi:large subunit ribosomal protein L12|nr:50S ribosomal protein P1 [Nitrososphaeraceae archaeon]